LTDPGWTQAALWAAVLASGFYHGVSPGMGWPLAVSAGLMDDGKRAFWLALAALAFGHLLSMLAILLPFELLAYLLAWQRPIQIGASLLVLGFGCFLLLWRGHPRLLARIPPTKLVLWSFVVALAHGAGLMLVPIYLGLCAAGDQDPGHRAANILANSNLDLAILVSLAHSLALFATSALIAWLVFRYLGVKFIARSWFNLDRAWALSLILVGGVAFGFAMV
jgi:hypothetical protein